MTNNQPVMKFCEYGRHHVPANQIKRVKIHDDGVNPVQWGFYCKGCITEINNEWQASMNDIATQDDYHQLWGV